MKSPNALQRYLSDKLIGPAAQHVLRHPGQFAWCTLKACRANQGLLLAGAVAYYALLSIVPLLVLTVMALSRVIDARELLVTIGRYQGQRAAIIVVSPAGGGPARIWVVGTGCSATSSDVITQMALPGSG